MDVNMSVTPILVRAFVGTSCPTPLDDSCSKFQNVEVVGETQAIRIGTTDLVILGHDSVDESARGNGSCLLFTGRPFSGDQPAWEHSFDLASDSIGCLDGKFAGALIRPDRCELVTDFMGAGALYYTVREGRAYFATHLGLLLQILPWRPELNDVQVAGQLLARAQVFDETHFSGVFRLAAGKRLIVDRRGARTLDSDGPSAETLTSTDAPVFGPGTFWEMMDQGVQRERFGPQSLLMYSGGRDSTAIALADSKYPIQSATYGEVYSMDRLQGLRRARRLGLQAHGVPYGDWSLNTYRQQIVGLHGGCSGLQTTHNMIGFDWAREMATIAVVGFMGDALTGAHSGPACSPDESYALRILLPNHNDRLLSRMYAAEKRVVVDHVLGRFSALSREFGARRALMILDLQWRQARWISMMFDLCDWFVPVSYPFVQQRLVASCLQATDESLSRQHDYDQALSDRLRARGRRGYAPDSKIERFLIELAAGVAARLRGRRIVDRCDWNAAMDRTQLQPQEFMSGNERLDALTMESWKSWLGAPSARQTNIPVGFASATIAAASAGRWT